MWTNSLLKTNAKQILRRSYWRLFLICALVTLLTGGLDITAKIESTSSTWLDRALDIVSTGNLFVQVMMSFLLPLGFILAILVTLAVTLGWSILFSSVLQVGLRRYLLMNRSGVPTVGVIFSAFDRNYWNVVKANFQVSLRVILYSLLLIVPGVIKKYEYCFVLYLLAENPTMPPERALQLSSRMTDGEKWRMFLLDLSFLGWHLLAALLPTIGDLFVEPYYQATIAELYEAMRAKAIATGITSEAELHGVPNSTY